MKLTIQGFILAPILLRASAIFVDLAIVTVINLALTSAVGDTRVESATTLVILMVSTAAYNIGFLVWRSATPGKMLMNIYVAYPDGAGIRPDTALLRYIVLFSGNIAIIDPVLFYVFAAVMLVNIGMVIFSPGRRGIHDRISGTIVLAGKPGAPMKMADIERSNEPRP